VRILLAIDHLPAEANEQLFGGTGVRLAAAVRHWLSATGLIERVFDFDAERFQQL
jgi:hypothetical protein